MKTLKRILLSLVLLVILALIAGFILIRHISNRAVPEYNKGVMLEGLREKVEVFRDEYGVPHVYAMNEEDLYRAVGYIMAQDRLWQMDLVRHVTEGRLSEIFGADMVENDQMLRSLRIPDKSEMVMKKTDPEIFRHIEAFCDGVNHYISANEKNLPFEFAVLGYKPEPWLPVHSYNLIGYMAFDLTIAWGNEILLQKIISTVGRGKSMELLPDLSIQDPIYPDFVISEVPEPLINVRASLEKIRSLGVQVFSGSNNWAVSGTRTESHMPIVANDMHLGLDVAPGVWYQMHQVVEGKLNVTGVMLSGAPFIICGHNDSIAWGMTNVMLDDMDFYEETIDPDTTKYRFNGAWRDLKVREEKIIIKGGDTTIRLNRFTHRGPIVSGFKGIKDKMISMRWIGNEDSNELRTVWLLNRAGNWEEFKDAVSSFISIGQNIVYGDVAGNIGLYCATGIPVRPGNRALIAPGDTSLFDWQGLVPFEERPHTYNPESGFVVSANNRTTGEGYSYYISHWFDLPNRYNRIVEMLERTDDHNAESIRKIQTDQHSKWAEKILKAVLPLINQNDSLLNSNPAFQALKTWDYDYSAESVEATLFEVFYLELLKSIFLDELGDELYGEFIDYDAMASFAVDKLVSGAQVTWCDDVSTADQVEDLASVVHSGFYNALKWLESEYGPDQKDWQWGMHHQLSFQHPLGSVNILNKVFHLTRGPFPVGGSYHTVCPYSYPLKDPFKVNHGASERHIFMTGNWDESLTVIPTGSSGIPASDFYCNQSELYVGMEYHKDPFSREAVESQAKYHASFISSGGQ